MGACPQPMPSGRCSARVCSTGPDPTVSMHKPHDVLGPVLARLLRCPAAGVGDATGAPQTRVANVVAMTANLLVCCAAGGG